MENYIIYIIGSAFLTGLASFLIYKGLAQKISWVRVILGVIIIIVAWLMNAISIASELYWSRIADTLYSSPNPESANITGFIAPTITVALLSALWISVKLAGKRRLTAVGIGVILPVALMLTAPLLSQTVFLNPAKRLASIQEELHQNQEQWTSKKPWHYTFTIELFCFCSGWGQYMEPVTIDVLDGIASFEARPEIIEYIERYKTIELLFQSIQSAIDDEYEVVSVTYDPELGYPQKVVLDPSGGFIPDVRRSIHIADFEAQIGTDEALTGTPMDRPTTEPTVRPTIVMQVPTMEPVEVRTMVSDVDGMVMVYVPPGTFLMGSTSYDPDAFDDEFPQHEVNLDGYWIDKTEVTNTMFAIFLNEEGNQSEDGVMWFDSDDKDSRIWNSNGEWEAMREYARHPVVDVSWYGAKAYCQWVGRRLPTEAEWEKAARGEDGRIYPWGNRLSDCVLANYHDCKGGTGDVGLHPDGVSPYGALDMVGNVWEWVVDWYSLDYFESSPLDNPQGPSSGSSHVGRGGSWYSNPIYLRAATRRSYTQRRTVDDTGFRCARDSSP
jgi:formylglycine-generating enzyme required for sulfatase activity